MGLFSFNYSKPGPGVNADEPEKKGFFRFWEVVFEKFSKIIGANTLHALLSLPYLVILYIIAPVNFTWLNDFAASIAVDGSAEVVLSTIMFGLRSMFAIGVFMLWGSGPSSAMYAYITRCFTRRDPVWIMSDGFAKFKENFKQSIIVVIIDIVVIFLGTNAVMFYYSFYSSTGSMIWMFMCSLMAMVLLIYTWMHFYIYQIMVTFECNLGQLYKNSVLFAIAMLPMNILITVITLVILIGLFMVLNPMLAIILDLAVFAILMRFPMEFTASRKISKSFINVKKKEAPKKEYIGEENN